jgi:hypothetical protein
MMRDAPVATSTEATAATAQRACGRLTASAKAMGVEGIDSPDPTAGVSLNVAGPPLAPDPAGTAQVYLHRGQAVDPLDQRLRATTSGRRA